MSVVFISYRRADCPDSVARLSEKLKACLRNREVFYDHTSIELGAEFPQLLRDKVTEADVVLVCIGPKWLELLRARRGDTIDFVREEIRQALAVNNDVIPLLIGGHLQIPSQADLADFPELLPLIGKNALQVRPDPNFVPDSDKLLDYLERTGPTEIIGTILGGKYKVLRLVDVGGMGEVYEAAQTDMKRTVAVKLVKAGMDTKEVLARFDAERQALAVMDHPNVCKVLDAGTAPNGRPFFVMEFVRGVPITKFCDERKLPPKERLELFTAVCKAVQHAHQKGIIHRDLKPANVLVEVIDGKPVPKVIDFGLAKALGRKLTDHSFAATEYGQWVGTLEYSSPEQAEGRFDIDTLTDVYSLGVLLHELLVGSPPFTREDLRKASEDEMRRVIREVEPTAPSTRLSSSKNLPAIAADRHLDPASLAKALRGDLDWIILKALCKEKNGRYQTPTALADDIHRHLTDQPISAGKPSAWVRLRKFYRRNRPQVIAGGLVAAALVAGIVGTTLALLESEHQRRLAEQAEIRERQRADGEKRAKEEEARAKGEEQKAKDAALNAQRDLEKALGTTVRVLDVLVSEVAERELSGKKKLTPEQEKFLEDVLSVYEDFAALKSDPLKSGDWMARVSSSLGVIHYGLGRHAKAEEAFSRAQGELEKLVAGFGAQSHRQMLADTHDNIAALLKLRGEPAKAEAHFRQSMVCREKLVADSPKIIVYLEALVRTSDKLAELLFGIGRHDEAEKEYVRGVATLERLAAGQPTLTAPRLALGRRYEDLGGLATDRSDWTKGLDWYNKAVDAFGSAMATDPMEKTTSNSLRHMHWARAVVYDRLGKSDEADRAWNRALDGADEQESLTIRATRANSRAQAGRIKEALAEVEELRKVPDDDAIRLYRYAAVYSLASAQLLDKKTEYANAAVDHLKQAKTAGFADASQLEANKDFDPVRERGDFKKLVAELVKKAAPMPKK